ncbi:MAG: hypothetical protein M3116_01855 [Actinomycetota bacterium]|nr:hypothetical protein [Actinomycetota bacterium]
MLRGSDHVFFVDPLPAKRGHSLTRAFLRSSSAGSASGTVFAEALGASNYALITGDRVQEFDAAGRYLLTWLPGACMIEPAEDVPAPAPGQRARIVPSPWDGLNVRAEEVESLALAAFCWQSPAGWSALDAFISRGANRAAAREIIPLLHAALNGAGVPPSEGTARQSAA